MLETFESTPWNGCVLQERKNCVVGGTLPITRGLAETVMAYFGAEQGARESHFALTLELPNARAALEWAEEKNEAEVGLRLAGFARLWHVRGQMSEAERWMERIAIPNRLARL